MYRIGQVEQASLTVTGGRAMQQETLWTDAKGRKRQMTAACLARSALSGKILDCVRSHRDPELIGTLEIPGDVDGVRRECKTVLVFVPGPPRFCGAQQLQLSKAKAGLPATHPSSHNPGALLPCTCKCAAASQGASSFLYPVNFCILGFLTRHLAAEVLS
jgi:hypothetical protein